MRKKKPVLPPHEFELDLAPLLAVMVKLVPVLLLSSAFTQHKAVDVVMPAYVNIAKENQNKKEAIVEVTLHHNHTMSVSHREKDKVLTNKEFKQKTNGFDLEGLFDSLLEIKKLDPTLFSLQLKVDGDFPLEKIIEVMDACRKTKDQSQSFSVWNPESNSLVETRLLFPDVVFTNIENSKGEG